MHSRSKVVHVNLGFFGVFKRHSPREFGASVEPRLEFFATDEDFVGFINKNKSVGIGNPRPNPVKERGSQAVDY